MSHNICNGYSFLGVQTDLELPVNPPTSWGAAGLHYTVSRSNASSNGYSLLGRQTDLSSSCPLTL